MRHVAFGSRILLASLAVALVTSPLAAAGETYQVDTAHSFFMFRSLRMGVANIYGRFNEFEGTLSMNGDDFESASIEVTVQTNSVDTGVERRDAHIKSPDFLNSAEIPVMKFSSTGVEQVADGEFRVTGNLSLHGVTKEIAAEVLLVGQGKDPRRGSSLLGFDGSFTIQRADFDMNFGPEFIGADVLIHFAIQAVSQ